MKKWANIVVSILIVILGVSSFLYGLRLEPSVTIFRYLTVDGTIFTTAGAFLAIITNIIEIKYNTEETHHFVYYIRFSAAVAEITIFTVVMFSQLPIFPEHIPVIDRYDSFVMHVLVPILGFYSFVINDSPIGKLTRAERWQGTLFITFYAIIIFSLIWSGTLPTELIPYYFLDVAHNSLWITIFAFVFIYGAAYLISWGISECNRRLSWMWFYKVTEE